MIRKITIATISVLLSASILFTMVSPLIPGALGIYLRDREPITNNLIIFGLIISFVFATILVIICVPWKEKHEEDENTRKSEILKEFVVWCEEKTKMSKKLTPLKALEKIKNAPTIYVGCASDVYTRYSHECKIIETALKALEIIKSVCPNIFCVMTTETYEEYKSVRHDDTLLRGEYDLLKEVLL